MHIDNIIVDVFHNPLVHNDSSAVEECIKYKWQFTLENTMNKFSELRVVKHINDLQSLEDNPLTKDTVIKYKNKFYPSELRAVKSTFPLVTITSGAEANLSFN